MLNEQLLQSIIDERINKYKDYYWVFFDTETSGLKSGEDQLLEIAAIAVDADFYNHEQPPIKDIFHSKVRLEADTRARLKIPHLPQRKGDLSKQDLFKMTRYGIPKDQYGKLPYDREAKVMQSFVDFLNKLETDKPVLLVAHNAEFDIGYMKDKSNKYGLDSFDFEYIDTLKLVKEVFIPLLKVAQSEDLLHVFDKLKAQTHPFMLKKGDITGRLGHIASALEIKAEGWHSAIFDIKMLIQVSRSIVNILISNSQQDIKTMKITEDRLKLIIKEELEKLLEEGILSKLAKGKVAGIALNAAGALRAGELATEPSRNKDNKPAIHSVNKRKQEKTKTKNRATQSEKRTDS